MVRALQTLELHGGNASSLRLGGALLAAAGADRVLRVWLLAERGATARLLAVLSVSSLAVALLSDGPLLLSGSLVGELAVWQLPPEVRDDEHDEEGTPPCFWSPEGVRRWFRDCIMRAPGQ